MQQKVLLVTSPAVKKNNFWTCSITSPIGSIMPPCDLASIAAVLRENNIEPKIIELRHFKDPIEALKEEVAAFNPNAIITNIGTASAIEDFEILEATKDTVEKRICFCFHAMAEPDELFKKGATHILAGDPEYSVVAAVNGESLEKGLWTKETTERKSAWIENLDTLPFPALDLIDIDAYHALIMGGKRFAILLSNRGCPYDCPYCVLPNLFGRRYRTMSVNRILAEIEYNIKEFGITNFFFIDSAININPDWTLELCKEIQNRNINIRWCSNMRIPPVTKELLSEMKKSGCFRLFYGVEDLDLLSELDRRTTIDATKEAFALTKAAKIDTVAFIILFPDIDKTEKAMAKRIVNMVSELKADALQCNIAIPYPGTKIFSEYMEKYKMSRNWKLYDPAGNELPYKSKIDLVKTRQLVYLGFFLRNPLYVLKVFLKSDIRSLGTFLDNSMDLLFGPKKQNLLAQRFSFIKNLFIYKMLLKKPRIFWATIYLNYACNYKCRHCYGKYGELYGAQTQPEDVLSFDQLKIIVKNLHKNGCRYVALLGGEPLLHEDMGKIVALFKSYKIELVIITNGSLVKKKLEEIKDVSTLCFSVDGDKEPNDYLRGEGAFQRSLDAIKEAKKYPNINIHLNATIFKDSINNMNELFEYSKDNGIYLGFCPLMYQSYTCEDEAYLRPSNEEFRKFYKNIIDLKKRNYPIMFSIESYKALLKWPDYNRVIVWKDEDFDFAKYNYPKCFAGEHYVYIGAQGDIYPCSQLVGCDKFAPKNIFKDGFDEAWNNAKEIPCKACTNIGFLDVNMILNTRIKSIWSAFVQSIREYSLRFRKNKT